LRTYYKPQPCYNPGLQQYGVAYRPILIVQLIYNHAVSKKFEAIVDTGSDCCLFQSELGRAIGLNVKQGFKGPLSGVIAGPPFDVYYHNVRLRVGAEMLDIRAGFSDALTHNLLGQNGFFDSFVVNFDPTTTPPSFEIRRAYRN
jgi:hypothetical protein